MLNYNSGKKCRKCFGIYVFMIRIKIEHRYILNFNLFRQILIRTTYIPHYCFRVYFAEGMVFIKTFEVCSTAVYLYSKTASFYTLIVLYISEDAYKAIQIYIKSSRKAIFIEKKNLMLLVFSCILQHAQRV